MSARHCAVCDACGRHAPMRAQDYILRPLDSSHVAPVGWLIEAAADGVEARVFCPDCVHVPKYTL